MEQLNYNLMYRWFVGLSADDLVWDPTTFTKNRDRLQNGEVFAKFMTKLLNQAIPGSGQLSGNPGSKRPRPR